MPWWNTSVLHLVKRKIIPGRTRRWAHLPRVPNRLILYYICKISECPMLTKIFQPGKRGGSSQCVGPCSRRPTGLLYAGVDIVGIIWFNHSARVVVRTARRQDQDSYPIYLCFEFRELQSIIFLSVTQSYTSMAATTQTHFIFQGSQDWFSRPLGFMPVDSGYLYVHFQ